MGTFSPDYILLENLAFGVDFMLKTALAWCPSGSQLSSFGFCNGY